MVETGAAPASNVLLRNSLKNQYHAGVAMLQCTIERCPDDLWFIEQQNPYWQIAYHTVFYTHLYLYPDEASFQPWKHARDNYQYMGPLSWPPHEMPKIGEPYTKEQVVEYVEIVDAMVDSIDALDLSAEESGFWWYKIPKLEHQLVNIRHIQHHAAQLSDRLRTATGTGVTWISSGKTG